MMRLLPSRGRRSHKPKRCLSLGRSGKQYLSFAWMHPWIVTVLPGRTLCNRREGVMVSALSWALSSEGLDEVDEDGR